MIGLDTNVLVRYIMQDDPKQAQKATRLIGGLAAAQALRLMPEYSELPIIAVSALATEEMSQALQDGLIDGYLPKPFHAHALVQKVRLHLD